MPGVLKKRACMRTGAANMFITGSLSQFFFLGLHDQFPANEPSFMNTVSFLHVLLAEKPTFKLTLLSGVGTCSLFGRCIALPVNTIFN